MPTLKKAETIGEIEELLNRATLAVLTEYRGLTVAEITKLRRELRSKGIEYHVTKNTLVREAANRAGVQGLDPVLNGPTAIAFSFDEFKGPVQALQEAGRTYRVLKFKGGIVGKKYISEEAVENLTKLPTRNELIGQLLGGLQSPLVGLVTTLNAPAQELVGTINNLSSSLVYTLMAYEAKLKQGGEQAPSA